MKNIMHERLLQAAIVATLATASSLAVAQTPNDPATTPPAESRDQDRGFDDWGLLGLLGLLGLVPRKRRDVQRDADIEARRTNPIR